MRRLQHAYFPVNFAKFLRILFLQNASGGFCVLLLVLFQMDALNISDGCTKYIQLPDATGKVEYITRLS